MTQRARRRLGALLVGYLLGAIPVGIVVGKVTKGLDLREYGSGKMGATNALRTLGRGPAAAVLVGDLSKGTAAIAIARALSPDDPTAEVLAASGAAIGHSWSVFIGWGGGRSVLVGLASLIVLCPPVGAFSALVGGGVVVITRYMSLGSMLGAAVAPAAMAHYVVHKSRPPIYLVYTLGLAAFIVARHRDNIRRLRAGTERKVGQKAIKRD